MEGHIGHNLDKNLALREIRCPPIQDGLQVCLHTPVEADWRKGKNVNDVFKDIKFKFGYCFFLGGDLFWSKERRRKIDNKGGLIFIYSCSQTIETMAFNRN